MNRHPLISVVMPCYNSEKYLEEAVTSVMEQVFSDFELIVIDDGSTDASFEILSSLKQCYPNLTVLRQVNAGPHNARNKGLEVARGTFVAFLDADDFWSPDCLDKLHQALKNTNADLAYCGWQNIMAEGEDNPPYVPPAYEDNDIVSRFLRGCPWPIHAVLVKKSIVDQIGGFPENGAEDYDLWLRILALGVNLTRVPEVLAFYRWHDNGQISSIKWKQEIDAWRVRKNFIRNNPDMVSHIPGEQLSELCDGAISRQAYDAFWKRDLTSAQHLFRFLLRTGHWKKGDLKYILLSLLPAPLFRGLIRVIG